MKIVVISDSHAPRRWKGAPPALVAELVDADLILHAGDVCVPAVLDELAEYAPVLAVLGNNDGTDVAAWGAPETRELEVDGVRLAMIHDSGAKQGRGRRMRGRFPTADVVVFGHSHIPMDVVEDGVHLFNPGSVADPRRQPRPSFGILTIDAGAVQSRIVEFDR